MSDKSNWFYLEGAVGGAKLKNGESLTALLDMEAVAMDGLVRSIVLAKLLSNDALGRLSAYAQRAAEAADDSAERHVFANYALLVDRELDRRKRERDDATTPKKDPFTLG